MSFLKFIRLLYVPVHILSFSLRIRTVYEFRTLVRVHKLYGFRPRCLGYGSDQNYKVNPELQSQPRMTNTTH